MGRTAGVALLKGCFLAIINIYSFFLLFSVQKEIATVFYSRTSKLKTIDIILLALLIM